MGRDITVDLFVPSGWFTVKNLRQLLTTLNTVGFTIGFQPELGIGYWAFSDWHEGSTLEQALETFGKTVVSTEPEGWIVPVWTHTLGGERIDLDLSLSPPSTQRNEPFGSVSLYTRLPTIHLERFGPLKSLHFLA